MLIVLAQHIYVMSRFVGICGNCMKWRGSVSREVWETLVRKCGVVISSASCAVGP